jgi:3-methyladenine DNA glycosylase AlkD
MREDILQELRGLAEEDYREFQKKLLPGTGHLLGVRLPKLRLLAKKVGKGDWRAYVGELFSQREALFYEEKLLWGLCIASGVKTWEEAAALAEKFIPEIDNWGVCDCFCSAFKIAGKYREESWKFLEAYLNSDREYELRFGLVMLLTYFTEEEDIDRGLDVLDRFSHPGYYARMAAAWALSVYFVKAPEKTAAYLKRSRLDDWTYQKGLQKIRESYRVDSAVKEQIKQLKRSE